MDENLTPTSPHSLPPILPAQRTGPSGTDSSGSSGHGGGHPGRSAGALEGAYAALRRLPARDTGHAVLGGVCATVADRLGVAPVAVRAVAVVSAFVGGLGVGLYLLAWALLPDRAGSTHLEQGLRGGSGRSLVVLAVGLLAALSLLTGGMSVLASALPAVVALAVLVGGGVWAWGHLTDRGEGGRRTGHTSV